jgi:hypothetical protein
MTYTNELEVEIDFSDVDPNLLEESKESSEQLVSTLAPAEDDSNQSSYTSLDSNSQGDEPNLGLGEDEPKPTMAGRAAKFFRKKS